uniref:Uncharacterized protein n=1 Tax=viral metagenome TaxID=1070528 RepID=A0A6C0C8W3_9ZZZZ
MSRKHSKKDKTQLSFNKTYSGTKDKFGEIITSPAQHDVSFATELESTSDPLKHKLYAKSIPRSPPKLSDQSESLATDNIFASEIKSVSSPMATETSILPSIHDEGFSSSHKESENLRINNLENRITALETHILDVSKEMGRILEHQINIIKAIEGLSIEIRNTKNQIAR